MGLGILFLFSRVRIIGLGYIYYVPKPMAQSRCMLKGSKSLFLTQLKSHKQLTTHTESPIETPDDLWMIELIIF